MASERIVFVLGAGASMPYGFPDGQGLVERICSSFDTEVSNFMGPGPVTESAPQFTRALRESGRYSIDQFLEYNPGFREIGKLAIAWALKTKEKGKSVFPAERIPDDWYKFLFNRIASASTAEFPKLPVSFISYNYDRSLEFYIHTALRNAYRLEDSGARGLIKDVPIVHLHGQLGLLPWQDDANGVPFNTPNLESAKNHIYKASKGIKIIYEDEDIAASSALTKAHDVLREAEVLLFLGFGYDPTNLKRLRLSETLSHNVPIQGTGLGFTQSQRKAIEQNLGQCAGGASRSAGISIQPHRNMELLTNTKWLL